MEKDLKDRKDLKDAYGQESLDVGFPLVIFVALPAAAAAEPADELEGLWKAKQRFGPDARGLLVIQRNGATYSAEMVGRIVPVRADNGVLSFDLPNEQGSFRGKLQGEGGTWQGHRILSRDFVARASTPLYPSAASPTDISGGASTILTKTALCTPSSPSAPAGRR